MIAFKNVIPANAQYTQSCRRMPAHASTAAIAKKMIAVLRYHSGDAPRFGCSSVMQPLPGQCLYLKSRIPQSG